jgi:hypothetical protein
MLLKIPTMLGTLTRCHPSYFPLIMKYNNYEECFISQHWIGFISFTKNVGMDLRTPFIHISSVITMEQSSICYREQFDYMLFQYKRPSVIIHHYWKKNKDIIMPHEIPPILFQLLAQKNPSHTIYSSHPHHL